MTSKERKRLNSLELYRILDTATEKAYDDLTLLASTICETPISLISLVDQNRQWFKSKTGLDATETPRDQAFCAHAIQRDSVMVVEDTLKDARFADNALVIGEPNIRFYAGAPLIVSDGHRLGTLCVIDRQPRRLSAMQLRALETLRDAVVTQMELRRSADELHALYHFLPVCAWCKQVKVEGEAGTEATWQSLHDYICTETPVSHGICPTCRVNCEAESGLGLSR